MNLKLSMKPKKLKKRQKYTKKDFIQKLKIKIVIKNII